MDLPTTKDERALARIGSHFMSYGYCYPEGDPPLIAINGELSGRMLAESLLHECMHIVLEQTGQTGKSGAIKRGREESMVQATMALLAQILFENPKLLELFR
tara:strand:- start:39 stop:344 length:306 start_codon:yes stop_codon:yes gene_type:complete